MGRAFEYRRAAKERRWANMSRIFPKLARAITIAAKSGGQDPSLNPMLRTAISNAKAQNMPKDNIDAAIKRASGKDASQMNLITYEGKGENSLLIFVECLSDNPARTVANVKAIFNKNNVTMLSNGSLDFMFSRKTVIEIPSKDIDLEELELDLIDYGLEELIQDGDTIYIYGDYTSFKELNEALENKNIEISNASLERIANTPIEFKDDFSEEIAKLIEKLEDDEDVQSVFTNMA